MSWVLSMLFFPQFTLLSALLLCEFANGENSCELAFHRKFPPIHVCLVHLHWCYVNLQMGKIHVNWHFTGNFLQARNEALCPNLRKKGHK